MRHRGAEEEEEEGDEEETISARAEVPLWDGLAGHGLTNPSSEEGGFQRVFYSGY